MISPAKLEANRRNATKSTGPKTPEGKAASSANALSHGLSASTHLLLPGENPADYERFAASILLDLRPQSPLQQILAHRIIHLSWKLLRLPSIEAALLAREKEAYDHSKAQNNFLSPTYPSTPAHLIANSFRCPEDARNPYLRLHRYESSLDRSLHKALSQYHLLQQNEPTAGVSPEPPATDNPPQEHHLDHSGDQSPPASAGCHAHARVSMLSETPDGGHLTTDPSQIKATAATLPSRTTACGQRTKDLLQNKPNPRSLALSSPTLVHPSPGCSGLGADLLKPPPWL